MKAVAIGIFLLVLFPAAAFAQRTANLTVGYVGIDGPQLPAWMAKEAGIFQKKGLDVQPSRSRSALSYRKVRFRSGHEEATVLARDHLAAGFEGEGPLILEEQTSTVVVEPGWKVRVDGAGNLTLRN